MLTKRSTQLLLAVGLALTGYSAVAQGAAVPDPTAKSASSATTGALHGKILEQDTEKPVGGVAVILKRVGDARTSEIETGPKGIFEYAALRPGDYTITFSAQGMLAQTQRVKVKAGEDAALSIVLAPIETADVLRVSGQRTLIHPDKIGNTTHLDKTYLDQIGNGNNLRKVIESAPGVAPDSLGNMITRGEHNAVNYEIDGAILPEAAGVLQQGQFASPRSLQSMDVDVGGYEAKDGGGPMGAIVRMRSMPVQAKPVLQVGTQIGGPMSGGINYYASSALSQDPNSRLNKLRVESSGSIFASKLGLNPGTRHFRRDAQININSMTKVVFQATERDRFTVIGAINETYMHQPTSPISRAAGVKIGEHDRQNYIMVSHRHRYKRFFDQSNLHLINAFYSQRIWQTNVFDPDPVINGDGLIRSAALNARRYNYAFSAQGDISKTVAKTHHILCGFLSEVRPVKTQLNETVYNADRSVTAGARASAEQARQQAVDATAATAQTASDQAVAQAQSDGASDEDAAAAGAQAAADAVGGDVATAAQAAGDAAAAAVPQVPYGAVISPFTGLPGGPNFGGPMGRYKGFRYIQSAYIQDTWRPDKGFLKRLTLDCGARFDLDHGVFGNAMPLAQTIANIPGTQPFNLQPFNSRRVTEAQVSGRYGGTFAISKTMVARASFSNLFVPAPVDYFLTPFDVSGGPDSMTGIFPGAPRPLRAMRGRLVDAGIEKQVGSRFVIRNNAFYKKLYHFGDSGVVNNSIVYNRLTNNEQEAYGVETRVELKPARNGTGFYGYLSNTFAVSYLRGSRLVDGGFWDPSPIAGTDKYPDHDRRNYLQAALGYKNRYFWALASVTTYTGVKDQLNPLIYGPQSARVKPAYFIGLNAGVAVPERFRKDRPYAPDSFEIRIENLTNNVTPINLGSPYQGTRYSLPIRVLAAVNWKV